MGAEAISSRPALDPRPPRDPLWARVVDAALRLAWRLLWSWRR
jgi:hypothetical protein